MLSNEDSQALHDRSTRGEALSAQEMTALEQWYGRSDGHESATFRRAPQSPTTVELEAEIATAVAGMQAVTQRIQALTADNAAVRQEIADLQRQLTRKTATQTA